MLSLVVACHAFGDSASSLRPAGWLPGATAPSYLDGKLAGDVGFDPYALVALAPTSLSIDEPKWSGASRRVRMTVATEYEKKKKVMWMREAEMKHARLAMLAAAGWPISELLDAPISKLFGLTPAVLADGRAPSLINGHLFEGAQGTFLLLVTLATAVLELKTLDNAAGLTPSDYVPGDLGWDPLNLQDKNPEMRVAEIKHGRLAMLAVAGFSVQEAIYGTPVVAQTPQFFHPIGFY